MLHDLGIIMLIAGAISIICKWLKQPVVLGYIVAGLLAGPYVCGSEWVNVESAETWGQVGVIFLLFSLGLEFSFKKLLKMGSTAFIGCLTIVVSKRRPSHTAVPPLEVVRYTRRPDASVIFTSESSTSPLMVMYPSKLPRTGLGNIFKLSWVSFPSVAV